jgi:hypothetical protein
MLLVMIPMLLHAVSILAASVAGGGRKPAGAKRG